MKASSATSILLIMAAVAASCWLLPGAEAIRTGTVAVDVVKRWLKLVPDEDVVSQIVKRSSTDCAGLSAKLNQEQNGDAFTAVVGPRSILSLDKSAPVLKKRLEIVEKMVAAGCPAAVIF